MVFEILNFVIDYTLRLGCDQYRKPGWEEFVVQNDDFSGQEIDVVWSSPLDHFRPHSKMQMCFPLPCPFHGCGSDNDNWPASGDFPDPLETLDRFPKSHLTCQKAPSLESINPFDILRLKWQKFCHYAVFF
jgi:hypothetical protein